MILHHVQNKTWYDTARGVRSGAGILASIGASIRSGFGVARWHGNSCQSIGMLAIVELAAPIQLHVVHPMPSSKACRGDPEQRQRERVQWVKLRVAVHHGCTVACFAVE
jgi:hypothetical protein